MKRLLISGVMLAATFALLAPTPAVGITYDKLAILTFSAPVQVPGATLYAGTYRFRLANPDTGRNVMQVLSDDGSIVYSMFHTIPDSRTRITEDPFVTFREVPVGVPLPVDALFYGGEHRGYAFVYPAGGPSLVPWLAPAIPIEYWEPRGWMPEPVAEPPIVRRYIDRREAPEVTVFPAPVQEPIELPRTATPMPFVAVGGLASLIAGLGLALRRRR
jgi:LPXTG-motif cell wall-anchored protein